jgi:hypothetical protein
VNSTQHTCSHGYGKGEQQWFANTKRFVLQKQLKITFSKYEMQTLHNLTLRAHGRCVSRCSNTFLKRSSSQTMPFRPMCDLFDSCELLLYLMRRFCSERQKKASFPTPSRKNILYLQTWTITKNNTQRKDLLANELPRQR